MTLSVTTTAGTIAPNNSRVFEVPVGSTLTLTFPPNSQATVTEIPLFVGQTTTAGKLDQRITRIDGIPQTFTCGPYPTGANVTVAVSSRSTATTSWSQSSVGVVTATQKPGGGLVLTAGDDVIARGATRPALTTVVVGNSIAAQSKFNGTYWPTNGEIPLANLFNGAPLVFSRITVSTRADAFGVYGYSGQTLATINADLDAQLWTPLQTAGVLPDLVIGAALLENDIATGVTVADMTARLTQFIRDVRARFPGVILLLCTPRPSFSYNTPAIVAAYQAMRDYTLSMDNGSDILVTRCDGYENPAAPGIPLAGFTDASVHPNARGAMVNARAIAATLQRIAANFKRPYRRISNNLPLLGTAAATGTNVSGTVPTSFTVSGSANGTYVATAEQPGALVAITSNSKASEPPSDMGTQNAGAITLASPTRIGAYMQIEIVSGAENLAFIELQPRIADGSGNPFRYYIQRQTNDTVPQWQNGDVLTFVTPPLEAITPPMASLNNYIRLWPTLAGGPVTYRVLSQGCELVS